MKAGQERWTRTKPLLRAPRVFSDWAPPGVLQRFEKKSNSQCVVFFQSAGKGPLQTDDEDDDDDHEDDDGDDHDDS